MKGMKPQEMRHCRAQLLKGGARGVERVWSVWGFKAM